MRFYHSNLRNVFPQACWVLKAVHALPPYLLLLYYFPSSQVLALTNLQACLYGRRWQMRTAAFSTPSFHPHTALHQVLTPSWPCPFTDNLTGVWAVHPWLWGQNTSRAQWRVLPFCFISLAQIIRKLYNIVLQHTCYLVYKLLPHGCTVPAYQESQLIIIPYQNPNRCCKICLRAEWGYWSCTNHYIASKDELGSLRSSLCNEQSEVSTQTSGGSDWSLSSAREAKRDTAKYMTAGCCKSTAHKCTPTSDFKPLSHSSQLF